MYLAWKPGKTSLLNCAQCGQPAEAYSTTVTLASALPSAMSSAVTALFEWGPAPLILSQPARLRQPPNAMVGDETNCPLGSLRSRALARFRVLKP